MQPLQLSAIKTIFNPKKTGFLSLGQQMQPRDEQKNLDLQKLHKERVQKKYRCVRKYPLKVFERERSSAKDMQGLEE